MPKTCSQCQTENADEANNCSNCGAPLVAAATATGGPAVGQPATAAAAPAGAAAGGSSVPAYKFDAARWSLADRICGIASFILFISLFLSWFSASLGPISVSASGLSVHGWLYITLILCIAIIIYLALRAGWDEIPVGTKIPHLTVMMVATIVNLVLVFHRLHRQARRRRVRHRYRLGLRGLPRAHRRRRRGGALRHSAATRQDDVIPRRVSSRRAARRAENYLRIAASRSRGIFAADGSASNATKRRMAS